jgi:hypothetical protein
MPPCLEPKLDVLPADGDLNTLSAADRDVLCKARDNVGQLPKVTLKPGSLTGR